MLTCLIKVKDNLIEKSNTLDTIVDVFRVEAGKVGYGSKENSTSRVRLSVQLLLDGNSGPLVED